MSWQQAYRTARSLATIQGVRQRVLAFRVASSGQWLYGVVADTPYGRTLRAVPPRERW